MLPSPATAFSALVALAAVLGLIWLAGRGARWGGMATRRAGAARRLAVEEAIALDPRRRLHLIACDGRHLLLLTGGSTDIVIGWLPERSGP
jgi:flagellar protein FliO/FliZ